MIPDIFTCTEVKGCTYTTDRMENLERHMEQCTDQSKIISKQTAYGGKEGYLQELIDGCWLPASFSNYRNKKFAIYDIETLEENPKDFLDEEESQDRPVKAYLKLATIATSSNFADSQYFERKTSKAEDEQELVDRFMDHLFELAKLHYDQNVPTQIKKAADKIQTMLDAEYRKPFKDRRMWLTMKLNRLKMKLHKYLILNVYGYNSGN